LADAWDQCGAAPGRWGEPWTAFFGYDDGSGRTPGTSPAFEVSRSPLDDNPDGLIATAAIDELGRIGEARTRSLAAVVAPQPFFLALGFYRPHLPHNAPRRWFDLYPRDSLPLPETLVPPAGVNPRLTLHASGELLHNYGRHQKGGLQHAGYLRSLRQAYFASVSHVDHQIGRVLAALRSAGLADDTIVVVWGDHGYHLGDHGLWGKHTLHERALRSALIVARPDAVARGASGACSTCVESVDLFPTLADLCDLSPPGGVDGRSLRSLLDNPASSEPRVARSFWRRGTTIGTSLRAADWRFTQWREGEKVIETEFYDHSIDTPLLVREETHNTVRSGGEALDRARAALGPQLVR
jgi:arylsulfatase A-like enzyme